MCPVRTANVLFGVPPLQEAGAVPYRETPVLGVCPSGLSNSTVGPEVSIKESMCRISCPKRRHT